MSTSGRPEPTPDQKAGQLSEEELDAILFAVHDELLQHTRRHSNSSASLDELTNEEGYADTPSSDTAERPLVIISPPSGRTPTARTVGRLVTSRDLLNIVVLAACTAIVFCVVFKLTLGSGSSVIGEPAGTVTSMTAVPRITLGPRTRLQGREIDRLLSDMAHTRTELGAAVMGGCGKGDIQQIVNKRQSELARAQSLQVGEFSQGGVLKQALIEALEASITTNQLYESMAPGCPGGDESGLSLAMTKASDAKERVITYWQPIASQLGLPPRTSDEI